MYYLSHLVNSTINCTIALKIILIPNEFIFDISLLLLLLSLYPCNETIFNLLHYI